MTVTLRSELIDALDDAPDQPALYRAMARACEAMGLPVFVYLGWTAPDVPLLIANYAPEWGARFIEARYDRVDPILARARVEKLPYHWKAADYAGSASPRQRQMFDEAAEFGLTLGVSVPIRNAQGPAYLTLVANEKATSFSHNVEENRHLIHLLALHFDANAVSKLQPDTGHPQARLTPREIECLRWAARGKSTFEIAMILSISRRTVVFHLENVKRKFDVATTRQAIVEGFRRDIIAGDFTQPQV
jgi:LuxR family transcriptional regulator, activator of conjugal transfer of Ti plasmids